MKAIIIREATEADITYILPIINDAIENTAAVYDINPRTLDQQMEWFHKKQNQSMPVWVAMLDDRLIGYGSYGIFRPWEGFRYSVEHSIYVDKQYRNIGAGKLLLGQLIQSASQQGLHTMIAGIDGENVSSISLHKKYGFTEVGLLKESGYKFGKWLDLLFMQKLL